MSTDHPAWDVVEQLRSFASTLEVETGEPLRPAAGTARTGDPDLEPVGQASRARGRTHWAWSAAAAAAVTAVVVAGLVALSDDSGPADEPTPPQTLEPGPEPSVAPNPSVPPGSTALPTTTSVSDATGEPVPELSVPESGETQQTVIGDITWTLVEGDASSQPAHVHAEIDGDFFGVDNDGRTWQSSDGVTWELTDRRPEGILGVFEYGGETWARTAGAQGQGLARWDGDRFVPVELPESGVPDAVGLQDVGRFPAEHVEFEGRLVVPITSRLEVPWSDIVSQRVFPEWDAVTETIRLRDPESSDPLPVAVLTAESVDGDPDRLEFRDADTGELVTTVELLPDVDPDELRERLVLGAGLIYNELLIGDGDRFEMVGTPWHLAEAPRLAALDGRILAVVQFLRFEDGGFGAQDWELWTSTDARTWEPLELPAPFGSRIDNIDIVSDGSMALLTIVSSDGSAQRPETWSTHDGLSWVPVNGVGGWGGIDVTEVGWFRPMFDEGAGISVSPDGLDWQEIPFDLAPPTGPGGGGATILGRTIFVTRYEEGGARTMWVGRIVDG